MLRDPIIEWTGRVANVIPVAGNALYKQRDVRVHLANSDFIPILSRLWSHCATHEKLTRPLLQEWIKRF